MLPDFIIGGAPKCGTTSLFDYLDQHPGVFVSDPKEPHYFATVPLDRPIAQHRYSFEQYVALFDGKSAGQKAGEGSTHYLHHAHATAPIMADNVPDVRLVFLLRDPVSRAYSHYLFRYSVSGPYDPGGVGSHMRFIDFARHEDVALISDYERHIRIFHEHFDKSQILPVIYDDLLDDPRGTICKVCEHIGVDPSFPFDLSIRSNPTRYPLIRAAMPAVDMATAGAYRRFGIRGRRALLRARHRWFFGERGRKPPIPPDERAEVAAFYRPGVDRLREMLGRDLPNWATAPA